MKTKEIITFDDVMKIDIRVGAIVKADRIPKSDKLLEMTIDFGSGNKKQCVTNLGDGFEPSEMMGMVLPFVVNMESVKMMGVYSECMIIVGALDGDVGIEFNDYSIGTELLRDTRKTLI